MGNFPSETYEKRLSELEETVNELQAVIDRMPESHIIYAFAKDTIEVVIMQVVADYFQIDKRELVSKKKDKNQYHRSTAMGNRIADAKEWCIMIFRFLIDETERSYQSMQLAMPWISTRKYYEAFARMREVQHVSHPDYKIFKELVEQVKDRCSVNGIHYTTS